MGTLFIVSISGLELDCLFFGYKKENAIRNFQTLQLADVLEIKDQGKFVSGVGWYILVTINHEERMFASINDLEGAMKSKGLQTLMDIELEQCYLRHQLDKALESGNKSLFMNISKKYSKDAISFMKKFL
jgi:hypothetical protein